MLFPRRINYFSHALNREVVELYWNTGLSYLATNLTYIFEPIFLYNLGFGLTEIMFFYVILYTMYALLIMPITKITCKIGYKHAILLASIIYICYWIVLYEVSANSLLFYLAPIVFAIQKCLYWPAYNADVAIHNVKQQRGREVGALFSIVELAAIVGPVLGGFISYQFGFIALFTTSSILMLLSVYPLFRSPEIYTKHQFYFKNFWDVVRKYPHNFFGYWGYAEDLMLMSLWPIFVYLVIPEVFSVGAIITVASIIAVVLMLYLGKLIDKFRDVNFLPASAVAYGLTWLFRSIGSGIGQVLVFDVLTRLGKGIVSVPLLAKTYELGGTRGPDYAIAYAVFFEFSLAIGKILTALLAIWILASGGSIAYVFMLAGCLTMLYGLVKR